MAIKVAEQKHMILLNKPELSKKELSELIELANDFNKSYREGDPMISDREFDEIVDKIEEQHKITPAKESDKFLSSIGLKISDKDARKQKLPIPMHSLVKCKKSSEIHDWMRLKGISTGETLVVTPKLDGISFCNYEMLEKDGTVKAWTRGNGEYGQFSEKHFSYTIGYKKAYSKPTENRFHSNGEFIMKRSNFSLIKPEWEKYGLKKEPANPRNLVGGKINDKEPSEVLRYCDYIRYGLIFDNGQEINKDEQLNILNEINTVKVPYKLLKIDQLTDEFLKKLYLEWNTDYEIDGLVVEVNNAEIRNKLGRETGSNNPCYARAYKGDFETIGETTIIGVKNHISKLGYLKPVFQVEPIDLDGATVSNVFADNYKFVDGYHVHVGSEIKIKRSGMIIPRITEVDGIEVQKDEQKNYIYPYIGPYSLLGTCEHCGDEIVWDENEVEIMCSNIECPGTQLQKIIAFFEILECDGVSDGICEDLYNRGYKTINEILRLQPETMQTFDGWKERKANIVYNSIHSKLKEISLEKLQHASGCFKGLGSKKLALLKHFQTKPTIKEIIEIEGFKEKSAKAYLKGIDAYNVFIKSLPYKIKIEEQMKTEISGSKCTGWAAVFTGIRSKELEQKIIENGGIIKDGISKNTTHLIMKEKGSGSSKEKKAMDLGQTIMDLDELMDYLNFYI